MLYSVLMFICKEISYVMQYLHLFSPFKCNHFNKLVLLRKKRFAVKHTYHSDRKHHYLCLFESTSPLIVSYIGLQPNGAKWSDTSTVIWIHAEIFTVEIYRIYGSFRFFRFATISVLRRTSAQIVHKDLFCYRVIYLWI